MNQHTDNISAYVAKNENRMRPSSWLRLQQMRNQLNFCADHGASADLYFLPDLPQELLDRLDGIELEHLGPVALECGEMTQTQNDDESLEAYDDAPHRVYAELKAHKFLCTQRFDGGAGFLRLFECETKPNVMYLLESDGESGCWLGTRFGHFNHTT